MYTFHLRNRHVVCTTLSTSIQKKKKQSKISVKQSAQLVGDFHKKNMKFEETLGDVGLSLIHGLEIHSLINGVTRPRKGLKYF